MRWNTVRQHLAGRLWNWRKILAGSVQMCGTPTWYTREQTKSSAWGRHEPGLPTVLAQICGWHEALLPSVRCGRLVYVWGLAWPDQRPTVVRTCWPQPDGP